MEVEDVIDVEVVDVHLLGKAIERLAVLAPDPFRSGIDVGASCRVTQVGSECFDGDVVHGTLGVGGVGLQCEVDVIRKADR